MKLIWLTDIHLNFVNKEDRMRFYQKLIKTSSDKILITGDIAESSSVCEILKEMTSTIKKPIYFVLGNHDYYRGQVAQVRKKIIDLTKAEQFLYWLPASGPQNFGNETLLLGADGWADGRYGDYANSRVAINDSRMISDLLHYEIVGKYQLLEKMQELANQDAHQLKVSLVDAIRKQRPKKIIIMIHVPPFKETCLYEGKISNDDFLPFFASKAMGAVLIQIAQENDGIELLVLCGHTHSKAHWQLCDNLTVKVGAAEYTTPEIQEESISITRFISKGFHTVN